MPFFKSENAVVKVMRGNNAKKRADKCIIGLQYPQLELGKSKSKVQLPNHISIRFTFLYPDKRHKWEKI
jgi:hypothetical protein